MRKCLHVYLAGDAKCDNCGCTIGESSVPVRDTEGRAWLFSGKVNLVGDHQGFLCHKHSGAYDADNFDLVIGDLITPYRGR